MSEPKKLYDHCIVARNNLADLESQVRLLESKQWKLVFNGGPSLQEALETCNSKNKNMVSVPMRKELSAEEIAKRREQT